MGQHSDLAFPRRPLHLLQHSFSRRLQQFLRVTLWIAFSEHGVACNQNFGSRLDHFGYGIEGHAAINFNPVTQPPLLDASSASLRILCTAPGINF